MGRVCALSRCRRPARSDCCTSAAHRDDGESPGSPRPLQRWGIASPGYPSGCPPLRVGDLTALHPFAGLDRRLRRYGTVVSVSVRPMPETLPEHRVSPAGAVVGLTERQQLAEEAALLPDLRLALAALAGAEFDQLAISLVHRGHCDDLRAARRTFTGLIGQH